MTLFTQISKNIFCYPVIGQQLVILLDTEKRTIIISDEETMSPHRIISYEDDIDMEDFKLIATDIHMDLIDMNIDSSFRNVELDYILDFDEFESNRTERYLLN